MEPLYSGHLWDYKSAQYKEVSEVDLYTFIAIGTQASVHYVEGVLISEVSTVRGSAVVASEEWIHL